MSTSAWYSVAFALIILLMATGLITLLFSRSSYTRIKAVPYAFAYGIGVVAWLASLTYAQLVANTFLAHRFSFSAAYVLTLGMFGLALTFPNSSLSKRTKRLLAVDGAIGAIFIGLTLFTNNVLMPANFSAPHPAAFSPPGMLYLLALAIHLVLAVAIFVRRYLTEVRNRLYFNYIVLAFILLVLIGGTTNFIMPLAGVVDFAIVGPLSALLPFVAVVYALGITDINDVSYVVAQLIQVGGRLLAAFGLFVLGWFLNDILKISYGHSLWIIIMGSTTGVGIICFYLFGPLFDRFTEDRIAYSNSSPDETRTRLIMGLSGAIELDRNAAFILKLVKQTIGVRSVGIALLAKDDAFWASGDLMLSRTDMPWVLKTFAGLSAKHVTDKELVNTVSFPAAIRQEFEERGVFAVKRLHTESGIEGFYLLGEKFSQEIFTKQDATLMRAITEISDLFVERALFYNQIQSFNATLQQRIDDATQRLRKANKRLKTLDALKDDFISMASHQLRSPATSVHDAIKMLEHESLTKVEQRRIIELADASSERLVSVITDMLSVARIQAGHFTLERTEVELSELVDRAILQASALANEKHITLAFDKPAPIMMQADRAKLNEMMANYIENAIKYSDEDTTVVIGLKTEAAAVHFTVSDLGIGVPAAERKDLFSKFYRASNARHEQPNGNGIGLFVVKTIATAHGGDVYYQPLGRGSLFGFWLPL